ncbi:EMC3/TMCO1 family protein [archaeon]|nr:EMC3/TMCO1 family protein [archaeon]
MTEILGITLLYPEAIFAVIGISIGVSLFSAAVHRKLVDRNKMDEIRKRIETHQKEMLTAQKADDKQRLKQLEHQQVEVMGLIKKNFMMSMKPLVITMPVFLVILYFMRTWYDPLGALLNLPINIPFITYAVEEMGITNGMSWFGIYFIFAITTSLSLELITRKILKK